MRTQLDGTLLVLAADGNSDAPGPTDLIEEFADNAGWYDDVADGPVTATVELTAGVVPVAPAWVLCVPPTYAAWPRCCSGSCAYPASGRCPTTLPRMWSTTYARSVRRAGVDRGRRRRADARSAVRTGHLPRAALG